MSEKRSQAEGPVSKKSRKSIALEVKLHVLQRIEKGEKAADIARLLGLPSSTVRTIHKDAERIRKSAENASSLSSKVISKKRSNLMETLEGHLLQWVDFQNKQGLGVSQSLIQQKALMIFKTLQDQEPEDSPAKKEQFFASRGWFDRFRKRHCINSRCITGENGIRVWKSFLPRAFDFGSYDKINPSVENDSTSRGNKADFEEMHTEDPQDLASPYEKMTAEEVMELAEQRLSEGEAEDKESEEEEQKTFTLEGLQEQFCKLNEIILYFRQMDPNHERSAKVGQDLMNSIACYYEFHQRISQVTQQSPMADFFGMSQALTSSTKETLPSS